MPRFFGRGLDIDRTREALEALRRQGREAPPLVLLLGASGSGKSSLARAGGNRHSAADSAATRDGGHDHSSRSFGEGSQDAHSNL